MEKTLFLGDFKVLDSSKLEALAVRTQGQQVFIARGNVKNFSFNTSLEEEEVQTIKDNFDFTFVEYEVMKKDFMKYEHKFVVESNDLLIKAFVDDLNLVGRNDVEFLRFESSEDAIAFEQLKKSNAILLARVQSLTDQVSDLKILLSAAISTLTEEQKKQVETVYASSKKKVNETLKASQSFISHVSKAEDKISIIEAISSFGEEQKFEGFTEATVQVLQKLVEGVVENFDQYVEGKKTPTEILNDKSVINAVIIAYGQIIK